MRGQKGNSRPVGRTNLPLAARGYQQRPPSFRRDALLREPGIHDRRPRNEIPGSCCASPRNDSGGLPPEAAMISCNVATWRAKAPRPAAVAVTVVCGFLPTKALSTAT